MRSARRRTAASLFSLLFTLFLTGSRSIRADAQSVTQASSDCVYDVSRWEEPSVRWKRLSKIAELVSPSRMAAADAVESNASSGRGRVSRTKPEAPPPFVARNFIDTEIFGKMQQDGVRWSVRSTDEEFLRRVYLDLTGAIPDVAATKAFLADMRSDKRDRLIDELLASEGFTDRWTMFLGDHLQNVYVAMNTAIFSGARDAYHKVIRNAVASGKPYDQFVRELIAGTGKNLTDGEVNYWARQIQNNGPIQDTYDNLAAFSGERFLGLPLVCLSCHSGIGHLELVNGGLARRTRMEFWKSAAFFSQVNQRRDIIEALDTIEVTLTDNPAGAYRLNTTGGNKTARQPADGQPDTVAPAFFLSGEAPQSGENPRQAFGRMLTAHPQFARATVNYVWREIMGIGIVEPADSFDLLRQDPATLPPGAALQPTHPKLLTDLADSFAKSGYDLRALVKLIAQSNAYQLSARYTPGEWNESWTPYYARRYPRRLMAEALFDAIMKSTGVGVTMVVSGGVPPDFNGTRVNRAMQLPDPLEGGRPYSTLLNGFGRGDRDDQKRTSEGSIGQALTLMNDRFVTDRVKATADGSTVQKITRATTDPNKIVEELYLATLSRYPTLAEREAAVAVLRDGNLVTQAEDLHYALLNRLEFLFN